MGPGDLCWLAGARERITLLMNTAALITAENIKAVVAAYALYCAGCSWVVFSVASWLRSR